eukprot:15350423-Ditylum_brightwellii.AAC.1
MTRCSLASCPSARNSTSTFTSRNNDVVICGVFNIWKGRTEGLHGNEYTLTKWEKDELLRGSKKCGQEPLAPPSNDFQEDDSGGST